MSELLHSRYRLIDELGRGAMGIVWRAQDVVLDRQVAIKELHLSPDIDPEEALRQFLVEARAAARLSHPNLVAVHDIFSEGQRLLISMELVTGPTLQQVLRTSGAQPASAVRAVMAQVAQALTAAHNAGVVHRDLKPENVFWTHDGRAVVADFGLARIGPEGSGEERVIMGTPDYMAPEQITGRSVGPAADVFGWGALAYELATGRPPFGSSSQTDPEALARRIAHEQPPALVLPDDPALADLIDWALAKDPARRPQDGRALVERLEETRDAVVATVEPAPMRAPRRTAFADERRETRAAPWLVGTVVVVLVIVVVALVAYLLSSSSSEGAVSASEGGGTQTTAMSPTTIRATTMASVTTTVTTVVTAPPPAPPIESLTVSIKDLGGSWTVQSGSDPAPTRRAGPGPQDAFAQCVNRPLWETADSPTYVQGDGAGTDIRAVVAFVMRGATEADARAMWVGVTSRYAGCSVAHPEEFEKVQAGSRLLGVNRLAITSPPGAQIVRFEILVRSHGGTTTDTSHLVLMQKGRSYFEVSFESLRGRFPEDVELAILTALAARAS